MDGLFPPDRAGSLNDPNPIMAFDADDLILLRRGPGFPVGAMFGSRDDTAALERILSAYSTTLQEHGADVFAGDFTVFEALDAIVKQRRASSRSEG